MSESTPLPIPARTERVKAILARAALSGFTPFARHGGDGWVPQSTTRCPRCQRTAHGHFWGARCFQALIQLAVDSGLNLQYVYVIVPDGGPECLLGWRGLHWYHGGSPTSPHNPVLLERWPNVEDV